MFGLNLYDEKKKYLKKLSDNEILDYISREQSEEFICLGLSLLKNKGLIIRELDRLSSINLKKKLLDSIKEDYFKVRGIDKLYDTSDHSNIIEGLLPSQLQFGVEIEAKGRRYNMFIDNFHYGRWKIVEERAVNLGIEFVSPILHYTKEDLNDIYNVCSFMDENEFFINQSCAGHIHYDYKYVKETNELLNLMFLYSYFEKELYLISNNERSNCRDVITTYARSFIPLLDNIEAFAKNKNVLNQNVIKDYVEIDKLVTNYKTFGLNIRNIIDKIKNTVEFRIPNGILEYDEWHKNIILYGSLMKLAKKASSSKDSQSILYDQISNKRNSEQRIQYFMNLLFEDESLKNIYYKRYSAHQEDPMVKKLQLPDFDFNKYKTLRSLSDK